MSDKDNGNQLLGQGAGLFTLQFPADRAEKLDQATKLFVRLYNDKFLKDGNLAASAVYRTYIYSIELIPWPSSG